MIAIKRRGYLLLNFTETKRKVGWVYQGSWSLQWCGQKDPTWQNGTCPLKGHTNLKWIELNWLKTSSVEGEDQLAKMHTRSKCNCFFSNSEACTTRQEQVGLSLLQNYLHEMIMCTSMRKKKFYFETIIIIRRPQRVNLFEMWRYLFCQVFIIGIFHDWHNSEARLVEAKFIW